MNFSRPQSIFPGNEIAGKLTSPVASSARPTILADYPLLPAAVPRRSWGSCSGSLCFDGYHRATRWSNEDGQAASVWSNEEVTAVSLASAKARTRDGSKGGFW